MQESQFTQVLNLFNGAPFSTMEFIDLYRRHFPAEWALIEQAHGEGGEGARTQYSAYSRIAHHLDRFTRLDRLYKRAYKKAPAGWGSPRIRYWCQYPQDTFDTCLGEDLTEPVSLMEGEAYKALVNRYKRSLVARDLCIRAHGVTCFVCGFDFQATYGALGAGYIQVHHLTPLSTRGQSHPVVPVDDLRPLCANCHAMAHRNGLMSIQELQALLDRNAR